MTTQKDYCFCTLALGENYHKMAQNLATDLEKYSPKSLIYIYTDSPKYFVKNKNVLAFKHTQKGIQRCSNDRRFLIERVLFDFPIAIHIDADTRILNPLPNNLEFLSGITGKGENLMDHVNKYRPQSINIIKNVASKLNIPLENANWIGESLYIVARDNGKEQEFFQTWGIIANYLELQGMHGGDGNIMGLAAAKIGWKLNKNENWEFLKDNTQHMDASHTIKRSSWEQFQRRVAYHYRLNTARILALKDFNFYYR